MSSVILMAKKDGINPNECPLSRPFEEWLDENFFMIGPVTGDEAEIFTEGLRETNDSRYWAIIALRDFETAEELI